MQIKIVSFVKKQDPGLRASEEEYLKRIRRWVSCDLLEIDREKIDRGRTRRGILEVEFKKLGGMIKTCSEWVVLDKGGKEFSSEEMARWVSARFSSSAKELIFMIGGPLGLAEEIVGRAQWKLSLSKMTFPHKMVRVMVLEMLYRSLAIMNGMPYHK